MTETQKYSSPSFTLRQRLAWIWVGLMVLLLGAHFYRANEYGIMLCAGGIFLFLCSQSAWKRHAAAFFLLWGMLEWLHSTYYLVIMRQHMGLPWIRAAVILAAVSFITGMAAAYASQTASRIAEKRSEANALFRGIVFICIFLILFYLRLTGKINFLLLERFSPVYGSVEIFFVSWCGASMLSG